MIPLWLFWLIACLEAVFVVGGAIAVFRLLFKKQ